MGMDAHRKVTEVSSLLVLACISGFVSGFSWAEVISGGDSIVLTLAIVSSATAIITMVRVLIFLHAVTNGGGRAAPEDR